MFPGPTHDSSLNLEDPVGKGALDLLVTLIQEKKATVGKLESANKQVLDEKLESSNKLQSKNSNRNRGNKGKKQTDDSNKQETKVTQGENESNTKPKASSSVVPKPAKAVGLAAITGVEGFVSLEMPKFEQPVLSAYMEDYITKLELPVSETLASYHGAIARLEEKTGTTFPIIT